MKTKNMLKRLLVAVILIGGLICGISVFADDDEKGERERGREKTYNVPDNAVYKQECSSCHFLYLPGLLPADSWKEIMKSSDKHFGENLGFDEKTGNEILSYLLANSAEKTDAKWARKIAKSIGASVVTRITDAPYIKKEHRKIKPEVFKRPSIGSFSNCGACHKDAAHGDFEENAVSIPK